MSIPPGTTYGTWEVIREADRGGTNRRFECRCTGCGNVATKWLSNLLQGKLTCLTCRPWSEIHRTSLEAIATTRRAASQATEEGRICHVCSEWKTWANFPNDKRRANGKGSNCYTCNNWRMTKLHFGIDKDEWQRLHDDQGGVCALCGETEKREMRLSIDHDHACCGPRRACKRCIRGLLCDCCNRMLGYVEQRATVRALFQNYLNQRPFASVAASSAQSVLEDVTDQSGGF